VNPINGTLPSSLWRVNVIASMTYCRDSCTLTSLDNSARSSGVFSGCGNTGPAHHSQQQHMRLLLLHDGGDNAMAIPLPGCMMTSMPRA